MLSIEYAACVRSSPLEQHVPMERAAASSGEGSGGGAWAAAQGEARRGVVQAELEEVEARLLRMLGAAHAAGAAAALGAGAAGAGAAFWNGSGVRMSRFGKVKKKRHEG